MRPACPGKKQWCEGGHEQPDAIPILKDVSPVPHGVAAQGHPAHRYTHREQDSVGPGIASGMRRTTWGASTEPRSEHPLPGKAQVLIDCQCHCQPRPRGNCCARLRYRQATRRKLRTATQHSNRARNVPQHDGHEEGQYDDAAFPPIATPTLVIHRCSVRLDRLAKNVGPPSDKCRLRPQPRRPRPAGPDAQTRHVRRDAGRFTPGRARGVRHARGGPGCSARCAG